VTVGSHTRAASLPRTAFYAATAGVVAWAAFAVPLPFVEYVPNTPTPVASLIDIDGIEVTEIDGDAALLTVLLRQQPTVPAIGALLDDRRDLLHVTRIYPPGVDRQEYLRVERDRFGRQFDIAAVVGAQAAGVEADVVTEVVVVHVLDDSPADGVLVPGDTVLAVNGVPIAAAEQLQAITEQRRDGDELRLTIRHDGEVRDVTAALAPDSEGQPRLGIQIQTSVDELQLPFTIRLADGTRIGGPSAGLMVALTVYDMLSEEDLLAGRVVAGTGSLDADGRVGSVGGVAEKVLAAADYGAEIVLVPNPSLAVARDAAPDHLEVVGVTTLDGALEALRAAR